MKRLARGTMVNVSLTEAEIVILTAALDNHAYWHTTRRGQALLAKLEQVALTIPPPLAIVDGDS